MKQDGLAAAACNTSRANEGSDRANEEHCVKRAQSAYTGQSALQGWKCDGASNHKRNEKETSDATELWVGAPARGGARLHETDGTTLGNEGGWQRVRLSDGLEPLWLGNAEVAADLAREMVVDLGVPRDGTALSGDCVVPPRMASSIAQKLATESREMFQHHGVSYRDGKLLLSFAGGATGLGSIELDGFRERNPQRLQEFLARGLSAVNPRHFLDPTNPPVPGFLHDCCIPRPGRTSSFSSHASGVPSAVCDGGFSTGGPMMLWTMWAGKSTPARFVSSRQPGFGVFMNISNVALVRSSRC